MSNSDSLFDTPVTRLLSNATPAVAEVLRRILEEPAQEAEELRVQLQERMVHMEVVGAETEFLDIARARAVFMQCEALLDGLGSDSSDVERQLVQVAVLYFIQNDDAESDVASPIGFDDDAEVVELVAREIGREDLLGQ